MTIPFPLPSEPDVSDPGERTEFLIALAEEIDVDGTPDAPWEVVERLAIPPLYAPAANPRIGDFLRAQDGDAPARAAFVGDVSVGKNDPMYFAHSYSTKVPPDAIVPFLLHFTEPGDCVLDAFAGTGMTGIAAQRCAAEPGPRGGRRNAILIDLSPAATFIAGVTNSLGRLLPALSQIEVLLDELEESFLGQLTTQHIGWPRGTSESSKRIHRDPADAEPRGKIEYVVWSDVLACPECGAEHIWWDLTFQGPKQTMIKQPACPDCGVKFDVRSADRVWSTHWDHDLGEQVTHAKQQPVLINYSVGRSRFEKHPDASDMERIRTASRTQSGAPILELPAGMNTKQPRVSHGWTHGHHFFTPSNLAMASAYWHRVRDIEEPEARVLGTYLLTGAVPRICRLNRYMPNHDRHVGPLSGTLYVSQLTAEIPTFNYLRSRISDLRKIKQASRGNGIRVSTQSATDLRNVPTGSVDYIFTDPPFGGNLNYSELNSLVEMWLGVQTATLKEAIVNEAQGKGLVEYQRLMTDAFGEYYRVLRPGGNITVEFHNSQNSVWIAIQEALSAAGFIISTVRTLNKQKGTTKQLSYAQTVQQDLVINARKPSMAVEEALTSGGDAESGAWSLVGEMLRQAPVVDEEGSIIRVVPERQRYLLFDRVVAAFIQRGSPVPLSAGDFYVGLSQRFAERDGMFFLPEQVGEYDRKRMTAAELRQLTLFVSDESSAIQWIRQQLQDKPQSFQDLQPRFMQQLQQWSKHEAQVELRDLLEANFLQYDGDGPVPSQIHSYLSTNFANMRNKAKDAVELIAKASNRWYVPDPAKEDDIQRLRGRTLLKQFEEYRTSSAQRLKEFRTEAVRAGFKDAYDRRDYAAIIGVAEKLPESVLQEDEKLLMYYDVAQMRAGA